MTGLVAAALAFLAIHLGVSGTRLRDAIVARTGEGPYAGLFALASLAAIVWMCIAYNRVGAEDRVIFDAGRGFRDIGVAIVFIAFALAVPGVTRANPTSASQAGAKIDGMLRITRHPFLWGVAIWSAYHLIASGTLAAVILFGTFLLVAMIGTRAIDGKVKRKRPAEWQMIAAETSNIPFAAIAAGRAKFVAREIFDWRFGLAVALFAGFFYFHTWMFGVPAFPIG